MSEERKEMGEMGAVMEESREARIRLLAGKFLGDYGINSRPHVEDGVLVATNGRVLLRAMDQEIHRMEGDGDNASRLRYGRVLVLDRRLGGVEWCRNVLWPVVSRRFGVAEQTALGLNRDHQRIWQRTFDDARRRCPCCGEEVYAYGDKLLTEDEMENECTCEYTPEDANVMISIVSEDGQKDTYNAAYLHLAMLADRELGGLLGAWMRQGDQRTLVFQGEGWFVVCMGIRGDIFIVEDEEIVQAEKQPEEAPTGKPRFGMMVGFRSAG